MGECVKVDEFLMPWTVDADPFAGKLWAALEGKIRLYESLLRHARTCGLSDDDIVAALAEAWRTAKAKKARGEFEGTGAKSVFFATIRTLRGAA
jgi:hypothetical protein